MDARQKHEEDDWAHGPHQGGGDRWPKAGADAAHHDQGGATLDHLGRRQVIVGVGDAERIHRQGHAAQQEREGQQRRQRCAAENRRQQGEDRCQEGDGGDDPPPVETIRQPADRPLGDNAAGHRDAHQQRDLRDREADAIAVDRAQGEQGAVGHAGRRGARYAERRQAVKLADRNLLGDLEGRGRARGQGNGHHGKRDHHRGQQKQEKPGRIGHVQQQLAQRQAGKHHHHIDRQQLTAAFIGGAVVEPALRHDINPGVGEAGHEAHGGPGERFDGGDMDQDGDRGERGEGRKHAHMADVHDDPGRERGAGEKAEVIARHHQAGHRGAEAFGDRAQAQEAALQAVAQHQHAHAEQQRPRTQDHLKHDRDPPFRSRANARPLMPDAAVRCQRLMAGKAGVERAFFRPSGRARWSYCFSISSTSASARAQGRAERCQSCSLGWSSARWRTVPSLTLRDFQSSRLEVE